MLRIMCIKIEETVLKKIDKLAKMFDMKRSELVRKFILEKIVEIEKELREQEKIEKQLKAKLFKVKVY